MEIFIFWLILSFVVGFVGSSRKIGFAGAFFASILLSPLIGLIITLVSKNKEEEAYKKEVLKVQTEQKATLEKLAKTEKSNISTNSITDELQKLKDLKDSEVITEDEFQKLKSRIIDTNFEESKTNEENDSNQSEEIIHINDYKKVKSNLKIGDRIVQLNSTDNITIINEAQYKGETKLHFDGKYNVLLKK